MLARSFVRPLVCLLALPALAAPRGLEFSSPADAVTQVDTRFGEWMKNKGDRKAVLATRAEVEARLKPLTADAKELKTLSNEAMANMKLGKLPAKFTPAKAFIDPLQRTGPGEGSLEIIFFEATGTQACGVSMGTLPDGRWVLLGGPMCREAPLDRLMQNEKKVYLEKQGEAWAEVARPATGATK